MISQPLIKETNMKLLLLSLALITSVMAIEYQNIPYPEYGPDLDGYRYCSRRAGNQCCAGRDDYCTAPILDSVCYCDIFCNRTVSDCCPDFWLLCMGMASPPEGAMVPPPPVNTVTSKCLIVSGVGFRDVCLTI